MLYCTRVDKTFRLSQKGTAYFRVFERYVVNVTFCFSKIVLAIEKRIIFKLFSLLTL